MAGGGLVLADVAGVGGVPGCDGVWCGSEGVGEGLVGGYGGEYGVFLGVGVGYGSVSSDAGVDVAAGEVVVDVWPGLGESGVPVLEEVVGFEAGGVLSWGRVTAVVGIWALWAWSRILRWACCPEGSPSNAAIRWWAPAVRMVWRWVWVNAVPPVATTLVRPALWAAIASV